MVNAPFLELAFYLGRERAGDAVGALRAWPSLLGVPGREEELRTKMDGSVVVVRTEGEEFCGPDWASKPGTVTLARRLAAAFVRVAESIDCAYGAILVEYSLEGPEQLREDPRSYAFRNFYLSRQRLPADLVERVLALVPKEAYVRELQRGLYVSMSGEFNPDGRGVENDIVYKVMTPIGRAIGEGFRED